jgi:tetratricopeptide (TPR) repeat protein
MKNRRPALKTSPQQANTRKPHKPSKTVLLLTAVLVLAAEAWAAGSAPKFAGIFGEHDPAQASQLQDGSPVHLQSAEGGQSGSRAAAAPAGRTANDAAPAATPKRAPKARSKAEFDAYQSAVAETEPAKLEAAATEFAQRFPSSELRPFLFQRAMGMYQHANHSAKALEMARAVLKYDPANSVALLGAAQLLAEGTREQDLDRAARLQEAAADAQLALQHAGELAQPAELNAEQFESMIVELRGEAHEVLATVAYKERNYRAAIDEYNAAIAGEKEHTGAVAWLRLAAAHDKLGEYSLAIAATEKARAASDADGPVREVVDRELERLKASAARAATKSVATQPVEPRPAETQTAAPDESQPVEKTQNSRSPAASE